MAVHTLVEADAEDKDVQTLIFLHCAGFHGKSFKKLARLMSSAFGEKKLQVLAPDLRAHGDTAVGGETSFTWYQMADELLELVRARNLVGKAIAVGHSLGAVVSMIAEIKNPGTFRGLWCFEPVLFTEKKLGQYYSKFFASKARQRRSKFESFEEVCKCIASLSRHCEYASFVCDTYTCLPFFYLSKYTLAQALNNFSRKQPMKRFDQQCLRDYVMDGFRDTGKNGIELKCAPESESHTYMAGYETYKRNINNQLKEIKCPLVLACGTNVGKESVVSQGSDAFAGEFPQGRLERYGNLGHFGPFEKPEFICGRILFFIQTQLNSNTAVPRYLSYQAARL
jgi:pimeloyl-ACP methyl ester carboxylesterase